MNILNYTTIAIDNMKFNLLAPIPRGSKLNFTLPLGLGRKGEFNLRLLVIYRVI